MKTVNFTYEQPLATGKALQNLHFSSPQQWMEYTMALATGGAGVDPERVERFDCNFRRQFDDPSDYFDTTDDFHGDTPATELYQWALNFKARPSIVEAIHANPVELPPLATEYTTMEQPSLYMEECGMFLDTNAYFMGEENCMVNLVEVPETKPIVWIGACYGAVHFARQNHFNNRGIALIRAIHALERQSVSVGLFGYSESELRDYKPGTANTVIVKRPERPLSEPELINMFCECGPFRSMGFATISAGVPAGKSSHCGAMQTIQAKRLAGTELAAHKLVILPYEHDHFRPYDLYSCPERATEWTMEQIKEQAGI